MSDRTDYFSRVGGRVDLAALRSCFATVVGLGSVGSAIALELARCGIGHLAFIDGAALKMHNLARHVLPAAYVGVNKAEGMAAHLQNNVPDLDVGALARHVDDSMTDLELDELLAPGDLVIVATDRRTVQRRVARRALAMDIPALIPGLDTAGGGEVFVQLGPGQPCFSCWDGFREPDAEVRGATSVNADALMVVQEATYLSLGVLDPRSEHARDLAPLPRDSRPRQLFIVQPGAPLLRVPARRRPGCGACAVGPSPLNQSAARASGPQAAGRHLGGRAGRAAAAGWAFKANTDAEPPAVDAVEVSERLVVEGATVTLSWTASKATHVEVETIGRQPATGRAEVVVNDTRAWRVVAVNPIGRSEPAASPVVRVIPLPRLKPIDPPAFPSVAPPPILGSPTPPTFSAGVVFAERASSVTNGAALSWPPTIFSMRGGPQK